MTRRLPRIGLAQVGILVLILLSGFRPEFNLLVKAMLVLVVFAGGGVLLRYTRFALGARALRGNRVAAYVLSSTLAGLAGTAFSLYTSSGYSLSAVGVELDSIAAAVIGARCCRVAPDQCWGRSSAC